MNKEWVAQKNKEAKNRYEKQKKEIYDKLISSEYLTGKDKKRALSQFKKGNFFGIGLITDNLYLDFEDDEGNSTEKSLKCMQWHNSLNLESLNDYTENQYDEYLDSKPMYFDGDIIITDPCYICRKKESVGEYPSRLDFFSYKAIDEYPDYMVVTDKTIEDSDSVPELDSLKKMLIELGIGGHYFSKQYEEEQERYDEAIALYDRNNTSDWEICNYGFEMEKLGITHFMTRDTLYGDWSCTTYDCSTKKEIGKFCADAGLVSVISLDEILKYNPDFDYHLHKQWTTTWIKDFKGTVQFIVKRDAGLNDEREDYSVEVIGIGVNKQTNEPIHFIGIQTGL